MDRDGYFLPCWVVVLGLAMLVSVWGATAGALFGAGAPPVNTAELAHVLATLPHHLADPRLAWPASTRASLPGPFGFYAALVVLLTIVCVGATVVMRRRGRGHPQRGGQEGASWARRADLVALRHASRLKSLRRRQPASTPGRMALGWNGRQLLRAEERHALVVFGPPQSGKSAGLAVGALLEWEGPAIASSIKTDLLQATIARRRTLGRVFVFDPFGLSGEPNEHAGRPLRGATTFDGALEVAHRLASAGEIDQRIRRERRVLDGCRRAAPRPAALRRSLHRQRDRGARPLGLRAGRARTPRHAAGSRPPRRVRDSTPGRAGRLRRSRRVRSPARADSRVYRRHRPGAAARVPLRARAAVCRLERHHAGWAARREQHALPRRGRKSVPAIAADLPRAAGRADRPRLQRSQPQRRAAPNTSPAVS